MWRLLVAIDDHPDFTFALGEDPERLRPIVGHRDAVAVGLEDGFRHLGYFWFVVDNKDQFAVAAGGSVAR